MPVDSDAIEVRVSRLPGQEDVPLPTRQTELAAGFDLHAAVAEPTPLPPGEVRLIPCGFVMALPAGCEAQVRPRSGLATRFAVGMPNSPGTIDADYRGEVMVPLINWGREVFTVTRGMRIAQMIIQRVPQARMVAVATADELGSTGRGTGGFGSTGH